MARPGTEGTTQKPAICNDETKTKRVEECPKCEHDRRRNQGVVGKQNEGLRLCPQEPARNVGDRRYAGITAEGASARSAWGRAFAPPGAARASARSAGNSRYSSMIDGGLYFDRQRSQRKECLGSSIF